MVPTSSLGYPSIPSWRKSSYYFQLFLLFTPSLCVNSAFISTCSCHGTKEKQPPACEEPCSPKRQWTGQMPQNWLLCRVSSIPFECLGQKPRTKPSPFVSPSPLRSCSCLGGGGGLQTHTQLFGFVFSTAIHISPQRVLPTTIQSILKPAAKASPNSCFYWVLGRWTQQGTINESLYWNPMAV